MVSTTAEASSHTLPALDLRPGELVRVRPAAEIFATLDASGSLDGLPFMPEMLKYCGRTLPVAQRADSTCAGSGAARRMRDTVHLQRIRCDGSAHDGCQAACLMFWKEAWLERVRDGNGSAPRPLDEQEQLYVTDTLLANTRVMTSDGTRYRCQATQIPEASEHLRPLKDVDQYVNALKNWKLPKVLRGFFVALVNRWQAFSRTRLPERLQIAGGREFPFVVGKLDKGETPSAEMDLKPGDLVRIKSKKDIVATLDKANTNRGLYFDNEMARFCGRTARVQAYVSKIIEESNGEMIEIKSDCLILEGVFCTSDYHRLCTRSIYSYWRKVWLEKVDSPTEHIVDVPCVNRWSRA